MFQLKLLRGYLLLLSCVLQNSDACQFCIGIKNNARKRLNEELNRAVASKTIIGSIENSIENSIGGNFC